ncbi:MAG: enoyl-CoA hydratase/isomerase family protein [Myxococcales bacterium]|nr:enoyl-CoA hydratase/isomerase family protein [Myxococcales bacterium]
MLARCHHLETVWRVVLDASPGRDVALLDGPGLAQLDAILAAASNHDGLRVLVLESRAPGSFCAGMDLQGLSGAASDPGAAMAAYASCLRRLRALRGVVVAVVDGAAVGGGVGLAAAADIALASERASFALPELTWGLMPAMVLPVLRERMPVAAIRWLTLSGARLDAEDARARGLVDQLLPGDAEAVTGAVRRLLRGLLRVRPEAVANLKQFLRSIETKDLRGALAAGQQQTARDARDPQILGALRRFWDEGERLPWFQRPPVWPVDPGPGGEDP